MAWHRWGAEYMNDKLYGVEPTQIHVTPPPTFVRSDVVKTVYHDTAMEGLSLLDKQATAKIASAFSTHPWVRRVNSVRKLPGGKIDVRLDYRQPVAMVPVVSQHDEVKGDGFFVVDGEGVLLPTSEFSSAETQRFVHIVVPNVYPNGNAGSSFGDHRVTAAARLAEVIAPFLNETKITSINVLGDPRASTLPQLELRTSTGKTKFWGNPPGLESPGEPTAAMKLEALLSAGDQNVDLRIARPPSETASR